MREQGAVHEPEGEGVIGILFFIIATHNRITSKMEHFKDEAQMFDTASSDFYTRKSDDGLRSGLATPKIASADRTLVEGLEAQASRIREVLCANQMRIDRLECKEELKNYAGETGEELRIIHSKNQAELAMVKDEFQKNMGSLDRELASLKREWKNFKEKQEGVLSEAMGDLRAARTESQATLTSLLKDTSTELKCKFATFGRQAREFKRVRCEKKSSIMQELEVLRNTLSDKVEWERKKRAEYEDIVLVLLDKTCEQGEKILRRIC